MAERDDELHLLGMLEASLGDRQRAMNGLHVDEETSREALLELLELERRIDQRAAAAPPTHDGPRHQRPKRRGMPGLGRDGAS